MAIVAGIDEAGFGPILGPLTVSAVVLRVPDELAGGDLWEALSPTVRVKPAKKHTGVVIGDSKKVYTPSAGLTHMERGVLAAMGQTGGPFETLRGLLGWLCPPAVCEMADYPWYSQADVPLPTAVDAVDLRLRTHGLHAAFDAAKMAFLGAATRVLLAGHYNRLVAATNNKATVLLDQTFSLIDWIWRNRPDGERVIVYVDRQGGRAHYLPILQRVFAGGRYKVLAEEPGHSGYRVDFSDASLEVHFLQKGETRQLPIALASMTSKYLRELLMLLLNRFWAERMGDAELKPTAGYYTDGHRFLDDIAPARAKLCIPEELLIRSR